VKHLRKRLTYANVMSTIAVFLVIGGASAFAASQLAKNSVGTKQLKKNSVTAAKIKKNAITTAKIKKDAVTGAKVNEATLETVPSATLANSLAPMEATHIVGNPGEPQFENGAHNLGSTGPFSLNPVGFYKDHDGIVHLQGIAETGSGGPAFVFTLPPGFRPAAGKGIIFETLKENAFFVFGGSTNIEGFDLSGKILGGSESPVVLDGVTFRAES
jgi:hypothetical protein